MNKGNNDNTERNQILREFQVSGSQGTQLCYAEIYLYANISKSTKRSKGEIQD